MGETTNKTNIGGRVDLAGSDNATYVIGQGINERLEAVAHKTALSDHAEITSHKIDFEGQQKTATKDSLQAVVVSG